MSESQISNSLAIRACGLVKKYENGRIAALDGFDLDVERGDFVAVCGPSGCGKSTFLNLVAAIDRPDVGELTICGRSLESLRGADTDRFRASVVGLVFQLHNLLPNLNALENIQVPMLGNGRSAAVRLERARTLLDSVGLADRFDALPTTLSGGERQRVAIARALANEPALLLADEPTGSVDSKTGQRLIDLLSSLRRDLNMTLVVVTHDHAVAERAERIVQMLDGRRAE